jgi:thiamine transport system ATP-binding protein
MLQLEGLSVTQDGFTLTADLSIPQSARVALMGASGSGKSTLLSLIAGFILPDAGRVLIDGYDVSDSPVGDRPLSILFQDGNLFPHLSVFDNVALGINPRLNLEDSARGAVEESLAAVGLKGQGARKPASLSGGQQSRVALARMLLRRQPLSLLDEPFAALDPGLRREMLALLKTLCDDTGQTLILATHDLRDAQALCDRVLLLENGRVVLDEALDAAVTRAPEALKPWL